MHKSQVFIYILMAFLIGVLIGSLQQISEQNILILIGVAVIILGGSAYHRTFGPTAEGARRRKIGFLAGCLLLVTAFGINRFQQFDADHSRVTQFNDLEAGGRSISITVTGYVAGDIEDRGAQSQFPFRVKEIISGQRKFFADENVLVITDHRSDYGYGEALMLEGPVKSPQNFESFDYITYLKKQGIRSIISFPTIVSSSDAEVGRWESIGISVHRNLQSIRQRFETAVGQAIPEPTAAYINGVLLGTRTAIPENLRDAFATTGTTHILAISGYNIAIVAGAVMVVLLVWFGRKKALWLAVGAVVLFTILTGASASVVRAAIMGLLVLFATGYGRLYDAKNAIVLAAAIMVFSNPFLLVFDIGFQLSFLAVIGLLYLYPILQRRTHNVAQYGGLKELVLMTLSAQIMVSPLLVGYFKSLSLVTLPVNILILPLVPFVMFFGFFSGLLGIIWIPLGKIIGFIAWAIARYQLWVVERGAALSFAAISFSLPWIAIIAVYILMFAGIWKLSRDEI